MEWTGFTDEQLRQLKSGSDPESHSRSHPGRKSTESHSQGNRPPSTRLPPQRGRTPPSTQSRSAGSEPLPLSQNQMLSKPKQVPQQQRQRTNQRSGPAEMPGPVGAPSSHKSDRTKAPAQSNQSTSHVPVDKPSDTSGDQKKPELSKDQSKPEGGIAADGIAREKTVYRTAQKSEAHIGKELDEKEGLSRELSKLEEFQQRQKEIEDENQRKKNLLAMAIADRKKKTQAEVKRLAFIQKELSKIEQFLTTDVNILRDKIEEASRHYAEAQ
ncbi:RAB6-interacting golgin-like [Acanthaster planci]|uniref:RAB6-interacting golgin n=1 Tax=Acanthaster planci TaxID=133434 RepID=A0A8B7XWD6_ACAPL|nr:RAB6-interacting golgin-like [Acanthaster planci]XP_022084348.1 RAB6-interacting golgin-like [Acanthaster planci]XP_022084350.1 RAB6-interacting golgin-like [Acanthaster planci]